MSDAPTADELLALVLGYARACCEVVVGATHPDEANTLAARIAAEVRRLHAENTALREMLGRRAE